ncbi:MAG: hypothetical protein ABJG47_01365 [Ekhidna sp.]
MKFILRALLIFLTLSLSGQQVEFKQLVSEIENNLFEVQTGNETYTHELELLQHSVLKYTLLEVDEKGKREEISYEFNVADLDPYVVREEPKKDIIYLSLTAENRQKFLKKFQNGEVKGYVETMLIVTKDIDNARTLKELLTKAIPLAKDILSKKLSVNTYTKMETWLTEHVVNAESSGKTYNQTLALQDNFPGSFRLIQTEITSKSSKEKQYTFNLSDVNVNSLKFSISGSSFSLDFETKRKQKIINLIESDARKFDNRISIYTNNVEEARDLKNILKRSVPLAEKLVDNSIPEFERLPLVLDYLGKYLQTIDYGDESMEQSMEGDCLMKITQVDADAKDTKKVAAEFNLLDINENLVDYKVSSGKMFVELPTKESLDLLKLHENDEFVGYDDGLKIYVENIEVARRVKAAFEHAIKICRRDYVDPFAHMSTEQKISWLTESLEEVRIGASTITQKFERIAGSDMKKIKLNKLEVGAKDSQEEIFEFNFTDLNPKSIQYKIGSKTLAISFETKFKEDIIKYYKDGKIENYQDGFELSMTDIEAARNVILAFNQIIAELNE